MSDVELPHDEGAEHEQERPQPSHALHGAVSAESQGRSVRVRRRWPWLIFIVALVIILAATVSSVQKGKADVAAAC